MEEEYTIRVTEVRHQDVDYTVWAESEDEAIKLALNGESDEEVERGDYDVMDRILTVL
jgi:hypothetical protein